MTRIQVTFSRPKKKALSKTHIGEEDFTIVKNVIEIRTRDIFDKPTSSAVMNPHGIETLKYVFHDIFLTTVPPKNDGNIEETLKLNTHCTKKCMLVNNRGHGNAP
mmetsp:Transcript_4534/g.10060  ORF Transcript_4534/g.10060 Transcript_4534/m.10060 type:complete len:105 (+) Transcript_4534:925-1239(+)